MHWTSAVATAFLRRPQRRGKCRTYRSEPRTKLLLSTCLNANKVITYPDCNQTRPVHLLAVSTNSLWLAVDDIEWLVLWLAAEHRSGGVTLPEDPFASIDGNCSAPNVHIRWCFDGAWEAIVIAGPRKGEKVKSHVRNLTEEKWQQVADLHEYAVAYKDATVADLRLATFHFLEAHMKATVEADAAVPSEPASAG